MLKTRQFIYSISIVLTAILITHSSHSQSLTNPSARTGRDNSPYSAFGIGTLNPTALTSLRGMGGGGTAYTDPFTINIDNPASYSFIKYSTLEFSADFKTRNVTFEGAPSKSSFTGSINNIQLGVPLKNIGGLSFGIHQLSNVYYNLTDTIDILTDRTIRQYAGHGGLQKAYIGFAVTKYNLSLGVNMGYTFGQITKAYNIFNYNNSSLRDVDDEHAHNYRGVSWNIGGLYQVKLKKDYFLNIGASYQLESTLNGRKNGYTLGKTYMYDTTGIHTLISIDTLSSYKDHKGTLTLPSTFSFGVHYGKHEHIDVLADFKYFNWTNFENFGQKDSIDNHSFKSSLGFSYTPDYAALYKNGGSYFSAITYRIGVFYNKDYVYLRNTQINDIGGTIGFGLPIRRTMSNNQLGKVNAAFTFGNRGTFSNGLAREYYFALTLGGSLNDIWFVKPVYD